MHPEYLRILAEGLSGELARLTVEDALVHFENYRRCFLLDREVAVCYLNRFLVACNSEHKSCAEPVVRYLLDKVLQFAPFDIVHMRSSYLMADPDLKLKAEILAGTNSEPETFRMIAGLDLGRDAVDAARFLRQLLSAYPNHAQAAGLLLLTDFALGRMPDWLNGFACPRRLADDFHGMLFRHAAALGAMEEAARLWALVPERDRREVNLNFAAEAARERGDAAGAQACYERSLALDPSQSAVRFRLAELLRPSRKDPALPGRKKTAVLLYTYNKAEAFGETLASLAASNLGAASVTVLLNGCTDKSREVAERARAFFPNIPYDIIELPVNIGAPAARNWLINRPETWAAEYAAFLDDDVEVPPDWLEWFLSVAEADSKVGLVGGKVVFPGRPAMLQYLYRYVSVANADMLKLNLPAPNRQYDTGAYDYIREARSVMGCLHLFRTAALRDVPTFDIRFSPSQVDDIDHDLNLCLAGWKVMYCGLVACVHKQSSGVGPRSDRVELARTGNAIGNDIKLYYKHARHLDRLRVLDNLSLLPDETPPAARA